MNCDEQICPFPGFNIARPYYPIEEFEITRPGSYFAMLASTDIILLESDADSTVIRNNYLHDIGRKVCHTGAYGISRIWLNDPSSIIIVNTRFDTIGLDASATGKTAALQTNTKSVASGRK